MHPSVKSIEYVRLVLNFITKIYYISDDSIEDNRRRIKLFLEVFAASDSLTVGMLRMGSKRLIPPTFKLESVEKNGNLRTIAATLCFRDVASRHLTTKIPSHCAPNQFYFSVFALLLASEKNINKQEKEILLKALKKLSRYLSETQEELSLEKSLLLPNVVF